MSRWRGLREDQREGEDLLAELMSMLQLPMHLCRSPLVGEADDAVHRAERRANKFAPKDSGFDPDRLVITSAAGFRSSMAVGSPRNTTQPGAGSCCAS